MIKLILALVFTGVLVIFWQAIANAIDADWRTVGLIGLTGAFLMEKIK